MLIRVGGGSGGFGDYMERGRKAGRSEDRDDLDQRIILAGRLDEFERIVNGIDGEQEKYLHITFGFAEDNVSPDTLHKIAQDFVRFAGAGYRNPNEIYIYAEAHVPRIKQSVNERTGEVFDRLTHIHIAIPLRNLATGTREEVFGLHQQRVKWLDAFQEQTNQVYGLKSPKDSPRQVGTQAAILERQKGDEYPGAADSKRLKTWLADVAKSASNYQSFKDQIAAHGEVSVRREGEVNEYVWFKPSDADRGINLRENHFRPAYFQREIAHRPTVVADEHVYKDIPERGGGMPAMKYVQILEDWKTYGALEMRFAGSKGRQDRYGITKEMPVDERLAILKEREEKFYTKHAARFNELEFQHGRNGSIERVAFPALNPDRNRSGRDFGPASGPTEIALASRQSDRRGDGSGPVVGPLPELRASRARDGRPDATDLVLPGYVSRYKDDDQQVHGVAGRTNDAGSAGTGLSSLLSRLKAVDIEQFAADLEGESSEAGQIGRDLIETVRQREAQPRIAEIRDKLEPDRLLASLAESHRLNTKLYQVEGQRIIAGRRSLTVNDFLTTEMHLDWPHAEAVLHQTWAAQQRQEPYRPPEQAQVTDRQLWDHFKDWKGQQYAAAQAERKAIYDQQLTALRQVREQGRADRQRIKDEAVRGREGYAQRQADLSIQRMSQILVERDIQQRTAAARDASYKKEINFREFLTERSNQGDLVAFERLRRMAPDADQPAVFGNHTTGQHHQKIVANDQPAEVLLPRDALARLQMSSTVDRNGNVSYYQAGQLLIVDQRNSVTSKVENDQTLRLQLDFSVRKFGYDNLRLSGTDTFTDRIIRQAAIDKSFAKVSFDNAEHQALLIRYRQEHQQAQERKRQQQASLHQERGQKPAPKRQEQPANQGQKNSLPELNVDREKSQEIGTEKQNIGTDINKHLDKSTGQNNNNEIHDKPFNDRPQYIPEPGETLDDDTKLSAAEIKANEARIEQFNSDIEKQAAEPKQADSPDLDPFDPLDPWKRKR